jgi:hypothetical protein
VATIVSTSWPRKCGLAAANSAINSDLVKASPGQSVTGTLPDSQAPVKTNAL